MWRILCLLIICEGLGIRIVHCLCSYNYSGMVTIDQIELSSSHFSEGRLANVCDNCMTNRLDVVFVIVSEWM